jgi:hypothetical protein
MTTSSLDDLGLGAAFRIKFYVLSFCPLEFPPGSRIFLLDAFRQDELVENHSQLPITLEPPCSPNLHHAAESFLSAACLRHGENGKPWSTQLLPDTTFTSCTPVAQTTRTSG